MRNTTLKIIGILLILLLLIVPLMWVSHTIDERQGYRDSVVRFVTEKWTGEQAIIGPFMVLPYTHNVRKNRTNRKTGAVETYVEQQLDHLIVPAQQLNTKVDMDTQIKQRGIYEVSVFTSTMDITGAFSNAPILEFIKNTTYRAVKFGKPYIALSINDMRGIKGAPSIQLGETRYTLNAGRQPEYGSGLHTFVKPLSIKQAQTLPFNTQLEVKGALTLSLYPAGKTSHIEMTANWPHPSFNGRFLPENSQITEKGFTANWQTSPFSGNVERDLKSCFESEHCHLNRKSIGVDLIQPVDTYAKTLRSTKYAFLFIAITFAAFLLFEVLKRLRIHPVQYGMVGLALALFFLLLLSLSEHMPFALAYAVGSLACVTLLGAYLASVLQSVKRGALFALGLLGLFAFIYVIISSEDYALLMGSVLLFVVLGTVMLLTKNVNWYELHGNTNQGASGKPPTDV